jgi:type I restriction enzyme S subunit
LERIRAERETLVKSGKIRREKGESALKECCDNSYYTVLPESWSVCRLGDVIRLIGGVSYDKGDVTTDGVRIIRGGNIQDDKILLFDDDVFLPNSYYDDDKVVKITDTVIVASTGSKIVIGKAGFASTINENVQIGAFLRIIRPYLQETARFVQLLFRSDYYRNYIRDISKSTNINNIKAEYITDFVIAFPPLAEQHRITIAVESAFKQLDNIVTNIL